MTARLCLHCNAPIVLTTYAGWVHTKSRYRLCDPNDTVVHTVATPEADR